MVNSPVMFVWVQKLVDSSLQGLSKLDVHGAEIAWYTSYLLVYKNNMPSQVHNDKLLQYADKTALILTGEDYYEEHTGNYVTTDSQYIWTGPPQVGCH